jgi:hypothetical protein
MIPVTHYGFSLSGILPSAATTTYEGIAAFSIPRGGVYTLSGTSGQNSLLIEESPSTEAAQQVAWIVGILLGSLGLLAGLSLLARSVGRAE